MFKNKWIERLLWLALIAALIYTAHNTLKTFVLMSFKVPTPSMEPTVMAGKHVLVNRMAYGRREFNVESFDSVRHGTITRGWAMSAPKRGDVVVFNQTCVKGGDTIAFDIMKYFIKRCVALPGDTFYIKDCRFHVVGCSDTLGFASAQDFTESITRDTAFVHRSGMPYETIPYWDSLGWNIREFGPMYIPKKGDTIYFNEYNIRLYRKYIEYELGAKIIADSLGNYTAAGSNINYHVMDQDYYFMCGDNTPNSLDSRFWGLIPNEFIVGRVIFVY